LKKSRCKIPPKRGTFVAVGKSPRVRGFTGIMAPSEAEPPSMCGLKSGNLQIHG